jgi:P-type Cu2+ transporter
MTLAYEDSNLRGGPAVRGEPLTLLDDPQEWGAFGRASANDSQVWESSVVIEGMHCAACSLTVEDALRQVPGVLSAEVSAASQRARVTWVPAEVRPSAWMAAVQKAGYRALPANDLFASELRRTASRKLLWQWLVAGLCMMQVMMYAWPAYVAQPGDLSPEMEQLLRWASWVLTLPVLLFSCGPFFAAAWRDLRRGQISMDLPVALGMGMTFAVSTAGTFNPAGTFGREVYFDSLTMFVFFLLTGRWLELRMRDRTAGALEALMNRLPDSVDRQTEAQNFERVAVRRLQVGNLIRVQPGEAFAADGVLEMGSTLVDEALLTGESRPLPREVGARVVAGSHNLLATVWVRVQRVGVDTRFAQIVRLMEGAASSKPPLALLADRMARPFLVGVLLASGLACAWWWPQDPGHALMVAVAVLVVTCPCALSLATPAALLSAAGALAREGLLVRNLSSLEVLAGVDTVVFDKTGTLTLDTMTVSNLRVRDGVGAADALALAAALAQHSLHPASRALVIAAASSPAAVEAARWQCDQVQESAGQGVVGEVQALNAAAIALCDGAVRLGSARFCSNGAAPFVTEGRAGASAVQLWDARGWLATFAMQEALRPEAAGVVAALQARGLRVHVLSGDQPSAVARIAAELGVEQAQGGCSPADKLSYLQALQRQGATVAMVGDGLNDAPVLAGAHVSFALGSALPLAQAQADVVVLGADLGAVESALAVSRRALRVVRQNLGWALAYNTVSVPLAVTGYLPAWLAGLGMAGSSLVVVANALRLSRSSAAGGRILGHPGA